MTYRIEFNPTEDHFRAMQRMGTAQKRSSYPLVVERGLGSLFASEEAERFIEAMGTSPAGHVTHIALLENPSITIKHFSLCDNWVLHQRFGEVASRIRQPSPHPGKPIRSPRRPANPSPMSVGSRVKHTLLDGGESRSTVKKAGNGALLIQRGARSTRSRAGIAT